jgi:hypothetical protein
MINEINMKYILVDIPKRENSNQPIVVELVLS